ncbi:MAG: hypothetical protein IJ716_13225 [Lachnospiraceae bacterium]|nr:hypothetical protein [Lachnospiraceae bacterium]
MNRLNTEKLVDSIGNIDEDMIEYVQMLREKPPSPHRMRILPIRAFLSVAACLVVMVSALAMYALRESPGAGETLGNDSVLAKVVNLVFTHKDSESEVVILEDGSFLNDFEVIGDAVHVRCTVSLENRGSDPATVKLVGDFSQEVEGGLLKEGTLAGHFVEQDADRIRVDGNSQLKYLEVEFVGEFAGNAKMSSKLFPAITVMEVTGE